MTKGDSNQHRILIHRTHTQTGGDARGDWNGALEKASRDFANQQLEKIQPLYSNVPDDVLSAEVKQDTHDWIYLGAKDYAWKQLEQKYPEPSKFQSFLADFGKIPILNSIPIVKGITMLAGLGSSTFNL